MGLAERERVRERRERDVKQYLKNTCIRSAAITHLHYKNPFLFFIKYPVHKSIKSKSIDINIALRNLGTFTNMQHIFYLFTTYKHAHMSTYSCCIDM